MFSYILPDKDHYGSAKYELTEDFSEMRDRFYKHRSTAPLTSASLSRRQAELEEDDGGRETSDSLGNDDYIVEEESSFDGEYVSLPGDSALAIGY